MTTSIIANILVVDDDHFVRQSLEEFLTAQGFHVLLAGGGREAFEVVRVSQVDLAILDVHMPEWDGFQVAAKMRQLSPNCKIVLFTRYPSIQGESWAIDQGLYDYLPKSSWYTQLLPTIQRALTGAPREGVQRSPDLAEAAESYLANGRPEMASVALESVARELEFDFKWSAAATSYERAADAYARARGIASEGAKRLRVQADKCRTLASL